MQQAWLLNTSMRNCKGWGHARVRSCPDGGLVDQPSLFSVTHPRRDVAVEALEHPKEDPPGGRT
eukprot:7931414-Pyramimonas_sp.AAC.1